mmetsp:Transcript_45222/g.139501  ORF Transcript_45222/g.139501 Transcript_45222/m.139501 type:complete len:283 (+) Transcript_45222:2-850(+)
MADVRWRYQPALARMPPKAAPRLEPNDVAISQLHPGLLALQEQVRGALEGVGVRVLRELELLVERLVDLVHVLLRRLPRRVLHLLLHHLRLVALVLPEQQLQEPLQPEGDEEVEGQARRVRAVEVVDVDAALRHPLELGGEREGELCDDEALEEGRDDAHHDHLRHDHHDLPLHHVAHHRRVHRRRELVVLDGLRQLLVQPFGALLEAVVREEARVGDDKPRVRRELLLGRARDVLRLGLRLGREGEVVAQHADTQQDEHDGQQHPIADLRVEQNVLLHRHG